MTADALMTLWSGGLVDETGVGIQAKLEGPQLSSVVAQPGLPESGARVRALTRREGAAAARLSGKLTPTLGRAFHLNAGAPPVPGFSAGRGKEGRPVTTTPPSLPEPVAPAPAPSSWSEVSAPRWGTDLPIPHHCTLHLTGGLTATDLRTALITAVRAGTVLDLDPHPDLELAEGTYYLHPPGMTHGWVRRATFRVLVD